jgi:hypothetical protein
MKQIGDVIKKKAIAALVKVGSLAIKLVSMITEFFKKIVNNSKIKLLEKKLSKAGIDADKITKALNKTNFYDPESLLKDLDDAGLFNFMKGSFDFIGSDEIDEKSLNKIKSNLASALPGITLNSSPTLKYKFSSPSAEEINRLINNTNEAISKLKGYAVAYSKAINRDKDYIKDLDMIKDRKAIKAVKSYIKLASTCVKTLQKFIKELTTQTMTLYKIEVSLLKGTDEYVDYATFIDDFEDDFLDDDEWGSEEFDDED